MALEMNTRVAIMPPLDDFNLTLEAMDSTTGEVVSRTTMAGAASCCSGHPESQMVRSLQCILHVCGPI